MHPLVLPIFGATVLLGVAVFALSASRQTRFAWILAWLCADFAGFTLVQALEAPTGVDGFRLLDVALSPWAPVLGLWLLLGFTGDLPADRRWLRAAALYFGGLSLTACLGFIWAQARAFVASDAWPICYLLGLLPAVGLTLLRVMRYRARARVTAERRRALGLMLGLGAALPLGATDLLADLGYPLPRLSVLASLVVALLLALLTLGADLLETPRRRVGLWLGALASALVLISALALYRLLPQLQMLRAMLVLVMSLFVLLFASALGFARLLARDRDERLRYAGRISQQLAHDLNTPLMAIQGAVDFLHEERRLRSAPAGDREGAMLTLLLEQVDRLAAVDECYGRLLRLEPALESVRLDELVERALRGCRAAFPARRFEQELPADLRLRLDPTMIKVALENLVRNAVEASDADTPVRVIGHVEGARLTLTVMDRGRGMDPRKREDVLMGGHSDKPRGQGLGLPFVHQVARAHAGSMTIDSQLGKGTSVTLHLPLRATS